jgi:hypothetical protein
MEVMKRVVTGFALVGTLVVGVLAAGTSPTDFSGTWVLDKNKSQGLSRMLQNIESYTMTVKQDAQQLTVENKIVGAPRPAPSDQGTGGQTEGSRTGDGRRGGGFGGGRGGRGGSGMGAGTAIYKLDGTETRAESTGGRGGAATFKALWKDNGRALELTTTRSFNFQGNETTRTTKERWELVDGGKTLKVQRTSDSPQGSQDANLVFTKQ